MPAWTSRTSLSANLILIALLLLTKNAASLSSSSAGTQSGETTIGSLSSVSPIAMGSLNLVGDTRTSGGIDKAVDRVAEMLQVLPAGTLIDTAEKYKNAEEVLGRALQRTAVSTDTRRHYVATKFAPDTFRTTVDSVVQACQESIKRLNVDAIDLYQLHYSDSVLPLVQLGWQKDLNKIYWKGLAKCYKLNLVKSLGVCNHGPELLQQAFDVLAQEKVPLVSNQISFNLMRYGIVSETKAMSDRLNIRTLGYSPLGKGILSGKYEEEGGWLIDLTGNDIDDSFPQPGDGKYFRFKRCLKETVELREMMQTIADSRDTTFPQIAYNWARAKGVLPIAGPRNIRQVKELSSALEWSLTAEEVHQLDTVACHNVSPTKEFLLV